MSAEAAAREAVDKRRIESRDTPQKPFDVLVQHLVTVAIGGGFDARELHHKILHTYAYRDLTQAEFDWALTLNVAYLSGGRIGAIEEAFVSRLKARRRVHVRRSRSN